MIQAVFVGLLAWAQSSSNPLGWWLIREPLMAGFWVGLIYGKPVEGLIIGAAINVAFLGWNSTGGANPSDLYSAGLLGTAVAIQSNMSTEQAVVVAVSIGVIGNYAWILFMSINSMLPSIQDKYAEKGDVRGIMLIQAIPSQAVVILVRGVPAFLAAFYGPTVIDGLLAAVPAWGIAGFNTVGKVLPAVGVAMLLKYMARKDLLVFFGLGFAVSAYMGMNNLLFGAFIGAAMGYIYISLQPKEVVVNAREEDEI
ncbi:PTS mannose/fructose/sorbose/N-acetylgalactosamine transporter subunit IIC [Pelosinus fermentans]|jgi:mannose/fructose/N-acetylgalactosamine-specific phosphotransferase system component IIC|uniref:Phosphotransferase system PTS sorbose-specific IIC subunit n=1 Tax=Pelosinus fermentans JBW45 TaxID=1192197 RepID=I9NPI1_9FIRM|nr:PTS sugar transporter subunit IIC [Pelosinus fermentans]AJQ28521.1 phosphotransferase system PTS sorbose-specific IIC subunit [Pelosinus fermentans JBW45]